MTNKEVSIKQLAKYGLEYVSLITSGASRSRPIKTDYLDDSLVPINEIIFDAETDKIKSSLTTSLDKKFDPGIPDTEKSDVQRIEEALVLRDKAVYNKLQEIDTKIKTDEYTKRVVLQTGFISFEANRYKDSEFSEQIENYEGPLIQIPLSRMQFKYNNQGVEVTVEIPENYIEVLTGPLKNYLPQNYFDEIFKFVADSESEGETILPIKKLFIEELWSAVRVQLERADASIISQKHIFDSSVIAIANKTNHFLAEDLKAIASFDDEDLLKTSLGSWVSDEDMAIEKTVYDDGDTEIFFPFDYDKHQLKVLGISSNKAAIVEGPPGTGKSQTISNLLVHLASTGKRVLFASQKDQAIRGVKDKLKTLDVPFLFGYIPDKASKLYGPEDEKDSATNTLLALNREFQKSKVGDLKEPLKLLAKSSNNFVENLNTERSLYSLIEEKRSLNYVELFNYSKLDRDSYQECLKLENTINELNKEINIFEDSYIKLVKSFDKKFKDLEIEIDKAIDVSSKINDYFKENMPERSGWLGGKVNELKLRNALKDKSRDIVQEVFIEFEKILFSDNTKSVKLRLLSELNKYFIYCRNKNLLNDTYSKLNENFDRHNLTSSKFSKLKKIIDENSGDEKVFGDLDRYQSISKQINDAKLFSTNELNREIKDIRKFYRKNITNYIRNRILTRISEANESKSVRATLAQVARSLSKTKKANKTFDRLKHNEENFHAMSKVLPIWMMSLDDVSRIIPLEMNAFDYVIIDEASQCNFAYAFPAMFRAEHTIFFGDSLQMRDDNILFKSNDQLNAIAKKHKIPEVYQIKAEEDTVKSVMDIANLNGFKTTTLKFHYRSPKELIGFSNLSFYEPIGRKLEAVNDNILPFKNTGRVLLTHIVEADDNIELDSKTNFSEVKKIQELISDIKNDPLLKDKSIAVLTFFNDQAELLRKAIKDEEIKVSIIDGIQGDERDIVIYSFVIKDPSDKKRYISLTGEGGEIKKDIAAGRVNVAFSRARLQVHCVTSIAPELWPDGIWIKKYLEYVDKHGTVSRRHNKSSQKFDSYFEEEVYNYLAKNLDPNIYILDTQVESLGFKIDLVLYKNNTKLAIECDGPTHFEGGDGQVYVENDWERQGVLEIAGWNFYRISYFDWIDKRIEEENSLLNYIENYFISKLKTHKTTIFKNLENKTLAPEDIVRDKYTTDFSDESVDVDSVEINSSTSKSDNSTKKDFNVGDRKVNQLELELYLRSHLGGTINIRYQSTRAGSSRYWRSFKLIKYDNVYLYTPSTNEQQYSIKYRLDRVVDFK